MRKLGLSVASIFLFFLPSFALTAEEAYQANQYQQALSLYQQVAQTASGEDLYKAQLRIIASQYKLGQYMNAAKSAFTFPLPEQPLWKARFLLYRIETAQQISQHTYRALSKHADEENTNDLEALSDKQWQDKINEAYQTLWNMRDILLQAPIEQEGWIIDLKDTDTQAIPTLFDFVVNKWQEDLKSNWKTKNPLSAQNAFDAHYRGSVSSENRVEVLLTILTEAARLQGKNREDARLIWRSKQYALPLEQSHLFTFTDKEAQTAQIIELLEQLSKYPASAAEEKEPEKPGLWTRFVNWLHATDTPQQHPQTDYGQSYAAFAAAQLLENKEQYKRAVELCEWSTHNLMESYYTKRCEQLVKQIQEPVLHIANMQEPIHPIKAALSFTARNIDTVYGKIYPIPQTLAKKFISHNRYSYMMYASDEDKDTAGSKSFNAKTELDKLLAQSAQYTFSQAVSYRFPYAFAKNETVKLPVLQKPGFYVVLLSYQPSFNAKQAPIYYLVLNNTDLALVASTAIEADPEKVYTQHPVKFTAPVLRIYALNLKTGQPESQTQLTYTLQNQTPQQASTNEQGIFALQQTISPSHMTLFNLAVKNIQGEKQGNVAFLNPISIHFAKPELTRTFVETDRAIYRPGQTVQLALYHFEREGRGWKTAPDKTALTLTIRDTNWDKVFTKQLQTNAYGTAKTEFTIPQTGLLGTYHIEAGSGSGTFRVEEYKRPEYEVVLSHAAALQYDKETTLTGKAAYYFGAPLPEAEVSYKLTRRPFRPLCWWWYPQPDLQEEVISQGQTKTDKDGNFKISFTPQAKEKDAFPARYEWSVTVRDKAGNSIDASQVYRASHKAAFFNVSFDKGFYDADTPSPLAHIKLTDINNQPLAGKFTAEISELENTLTGEQTKGQDLSLETWYGKNKEIKTIATRSFTVTKEQEASLSIPALPEGIYKLKLQDKQADTAELIFLVAQTRESKLALPDIALVQQKKYYPGSIAKILIGAKTLTGPKRVEVYQTGQFLALYNMVAPGVSVYSLPIKQEWRGGVHVSWFGASNYQLHQQQTFMDIPLDNKELQVNAQVPKAVKPGQKVNWPLQIKNALGKPVNAQALVRVYDKSLDYYAPLQAAFSLDSLYPQFSAPLNFITNDHQASVYSLDEHTRINTPPLTAPQLPLLNLQQHFGRYRYNFAADGAMLMTKSMASPRAAFASRGMVMEESATASNSIPELDTSNAAQAVRTDFSETAYFNPILPVTGGKGTVSFTMPQSLTAWNVMLFVLTRQADFGSFTAQTVTQKDVMVRLSLPRFWRENDQSTLVAQVTNVTNKKINAAVTIDLLKDGKDASAAFGLQALTQNVTISAHGNQTITWPVSVPDGVGVATVTATVRAGKETDAESRQLPLLPSKERLAESVTAAVGNTPQTLRLKNLLTTDNSRKVSSVTLRLDPSLFLDVLNAMPRLLRPSYNDALSLANRYVPLSVINAFYQKYPELKAAVAKLPKRNTQLPTWDNTDPARLTLLEETPWLSLARGGAERADFFSDIFNPALVTKTRAQTEKELEKYQTASGGYAWMPGGKPSEYITLRLLDYYGQILRYGGQVPQQAVQKALAWMSGRIEQNLKQSTPSAEAVSYALYAAHVFTAFPQTWQAVKKAPVQKWLDYADQHAAYMTPLGQTYAAAAYYRLGNQTKANAYLDLVLSQAKTDPVTGTYFAPEAQSWLWYKDTLSTQVATLHTLLEIRPQDKQADGLVKWLLFNRQAQVWRDTTAAAQTVYALLDYMQHRGLTNKTTQYRLQWGGQNVALTFQPFDWSKSLRWTKQEINVPEQYYTATVSRQGGITGFATLDAVYTTAHAKASPQGVLNVERRYLLKYTDDGRDKVRELTPRDEIPANSEVEVQLKLTTSSAFDFVLLSDPKPAGFENTELLSGWDWKLLPLYQEIRDSSTNFFIDKLPAGTYTLRYTLRPGVAGTYHVLPAQVQSMYAPQFSAHTAANELMVK